MTISRTIAMGALMDAYVRCNWVRHSKPRPSAQATNKTLAAIRALMGLPSATAGELCGEFALEKGRDFAAQIQPATLEQLIKAAGDRLRAAWFQRSQQDLVINGIPRGIDFLMFRFGAAGEAAKVLFDATDRPTFMNHLLEKAAQLDGVLRCLAQCLDDFLEQLIRVIQPISIILGVLLLEFAQCFTPGRREARAFVEFAD